MVLEQQHQPKFTIGPSWLAQEPNNTSLKEYDLLYEEVPQDTV